MWPNTVTRADLDISYSRGTGHGGQKRNKTSTKVRMVHRPTGITVVCDETRHQAQNRKLAFRRLAEQLVPLMKRAVQRERYAAGTEVVRTYHAVDQRVVDKRLEGQQWSYDAVIHGSALHNIITELIDKK